MNDLGLNQVHFCWGQARDLTYPSMKDSLDRAATCPESQWTIWKLQENCLRLKTCKLTYSKPYCLNNLRLCTFLKFRTCTPMTPKLWNILSFSWNSFWSCFYLIFIPFHDQIHRSAFWPFFYHLVLSLCIVTFALVVIMSEKY